MNKPQKHMSGQDQRSFYTPGSEICCEGGCNSSNSLRNETTNLTGWLLKHLHSLKLRDGFCAGNRVKTYYPKAVTAFSNYFIHKENHHKNGKTKQTKPYVNKKVKIRRGTYEYSVGLKAPFMPGMGFGAHTNGRMRYLMLSLSYHYYDEAQLYSSPVTHTLCVYDSVSCFTWLNVLGAS